MESQRTRRGSGEVVSAQQCCSRSGQQRQRGERGQGEPPGCGWLVAEVKGDTLGFPPGLVGSKQRQEVGGAGPFGTQMLNLDILGVMSIMQQPWAGRSPVQLEAWGPPAPSTRTPW